MRKVVWFSGGAVIAALVGAYFLSGTALLLLGVFALAAAVALWFLKTPKAKITVAVLSGLVCGLLWFWGFDAIYLQPVRRLDGETRNLRITVTDYSYETAYGIGTQGQVSIAGKTYKIQFYCGEDALSPGDRVTGDFTLRFTGVGGKSPSSYHQGKGIFLNASVEELDAVTRCQKVPARHFPAVLRRQISEIIGQTFSDDTSGFARALLLGDSSELAEDDSNNLSVSGVRHVIAVSGLHVSILFSLVYYLCGKRRGLTALFGIPILLLFAAVAGFTPSITRACVMQILMILALLINKEYDPPTALAFAVLVILGVNPFAIASVSFQLSVGCILGIFLFSNKIHNHILTEKRQSALKGKKFAQMLCRFVVGSLSVSLGAMVFTVPLCAYYFGMVSLVSLLANLLILPVITVVFYGVILCCVTGVLWLPLGEAIGWLVSWLIRYVLTVAAYTSQLPVAAVYTDDPYLFAWMIVCYVLLALFMLGKRKRLRVLALCITACLLVSLGFSYWEKSRDDYSFTVLDVGQGQCLIFKNKEACYVVDCGGDSSADLARQTLYAQGVRSLDGIIVTHYDSDHAEDVETLASTFPVETLYLPDVPDDGKLRKELENGFSESIFWIREETIFDIPDGTVTIFTSSEESGDNERSLCILFQTKNCDILVTGDRGVTGERALLASAELPKLEILVAGHHGSAYSTGLELLGATRPTHCVISVGVDNSYGHPNEETLERLRIFGCRVWRTDKNGTIQFKG